jgi:nucleotide-binding universal stress UspA family protein
MTLFPTRLLLATDGSRESRRAVRLAVLFSERFDSELHLMHVGELPNIYVGPESVTLDREFRTKMRETVLRESRELLENEAEEVRKAGGTVAAIHPRTGRADAEIVHLAEEVEAGMILVGSRGRGPLRRLVMGSVSNSVVHHAHCPVLVVRGEARWQYEPGRVLLAVDGSEEAAAAGRVAAEICSGLGAELHVAYAQPLPLRMPYRYPLSLERSEELFGELRERAAAFVEEQKSRLEAAGELKVEPHALFGEPDEKIVELSEELEASLIVIGSRGLGGVRRALIGSVSDSVVRHAHCPVLVVRRPEGFDQS